MAIIPDKYDKKEVTTPPAVGSSSSSPEAVIGKSPDASVSEVSYPDWDILPPNAIINIRQKK